MSIQKKNGIVRCSIADFCTATGLHKTQIAAAAGIGKHRIQGFERMNGNVEIEYNERTGGFHFVIEKVFECGALPRKLKLDS